MTALTAFRRVFAGRLALGAVLLASACQDDSNITFDDSKLSPSKGGSGGASGHPGQPYAAAGSSAAAGDSEGGSTTTGGSASAGGTLFSGGGGFSAGGATAGSATGGSSSTAGSDTGGQTNQAGTAGQGGSAGSTPGEGGMGGVPNTDPITVKTGDIDDTHLSACSTDSNYRNEDSVDVDGDGCKHEGLIKAPRLDLPAGALVSEATLKLRCLDASEAITISYVTEDWNIATVCWDNRPEVGAAIGTVTCPNEGDVTVDLTAAYQAWLSGTRPAYGIYLTTDHGDGAHFASAEAPQINFRPKLSVTYTP